MSTPRIFATRERSQETAIEREEAAPDREFEALERKAHRNVLEAEDIEELRKQLWAQKRPSQFEG